MWARSGPVGHQPGIGVRAAGGYGIVKLVHPGGVVGVGCTLVRLRVEHTVRMHTVANFAGVAEHHLDGVADLGADHRAQKALVGVLCGARCQVGEIRVGVATIETLEITRPDAAGPGLDIRLRNRIERLTGDVVAPVRGIVPDDLIGTDIVGAHLPGRVECRTGDSIPVGVSRTRHRCSGRSGHVRGVRLPAGRGYRRGRSGYGQASDECKGAREPRSERRTPGGWTFRRPAPTCGTALHTRAPTGAESCCHGG